MTLAMTGALAVCVSPAAAQESSAPEPSRLERYVLPNGLEVILAPARGSGRVAVVVCYRAGFDSEPEGLAGLAHLVEHMAFRGSVHLTDEQFSSLPQRWGATQMNAFTSAQATTYQMSVPREQLARALWFESERMAFVLPALSSEHLELERSIVRNEYALRDDRVGELIREVSYPKKHPILISTSDRIDAIDAIGLPEVQWFYQRVYRPDNASLVLAGDFDAVRAKSDIERYFGEIRNPATPKLGSRRWPVVFRGLERVRIRAQGSVDALEVEWTLPRDALGEKREVVFGLASLLAYRLDEELTHHLRIAVLVQAGHEASSAGDRFRVRVTTYMPDKLAQIERALLGQLARLCNETMSGAALEALRRRVSWRSLFVNEDPMQRALALAADRALRFDADPIDPDALAVTASAITGEQLRNAAREWLPLDRRLVVEIVAGRVTQPKLLLQEGDLLGQPGAAAR